MAEDQKQLQKIDPRDVVMITVAYHRPTKRLTINWTQNSDLMELVGMMTLGRMEIVKQIEIGKAVQAQLDKINSAKAGQN